MNVCIHLQASTQIVILSDRSFIVARIAAIKRREAKDLRWLFVDFVFDIWGQTENAIVAISNPATR